MSHFETKFLFVVLAVSLTACNSGGGSDGSGGNTGAQTTGAPSIQYQTAAISFTANTQNAGVAPVNSGGPITSCVAVPSLPSNLILDQSSCTISGAPRGPSSLTSYTITATGPDGTSSASVAISAVLPTEAFSGSLNIFWGTNGLAAPTFGPINVRGQLVESDGKMLALADTGSQVDVLRFNLDGSIDATWGSGGLVAYACSNFGNSSCKAFNFLMQSDGKLIIAGVIGSGDGIFVLRLNSDGSADSSYGTGGIALVIFTGGIESGYAGALIDPNTGYLVLDATNWTGSQWVPVAARLLTNGSLDSTFGTAGKASFAFTSYIVRSIGYDGNLKTYYIGASTGSGGALLRLNSTGALDTSFNATGSVSFSDSNFMSQANESIATQFADGYILFGAGSHVVRFKANGSVDPSFGTTGVVTLASPAASIQIIVEPSEKILVAAGVSASHTISITRYNTTGSKDTTFGSSGVFAPSHASYGDLSYANLTLNPSTGNFMFLAQGNVGVGTGIYLFGLD